MSVSGYHDLTPRFGVAYDLFGNGKTALKASAGRYLAAATADGIYSSQSPAGNFVRNVTNRAWTDSNANYAVDCNLLSAAAQNTAAAGGDVCGALVGANLNFGNLNPNVATVDPEILHGWGIWLYNWRFGASVQQQKLLPGGGARSRLQPAPLGQLPRHLQPVGRPRRLRHLGRAGPDHPDLPNAGSTASFVAITPAAAARGVQDFQTTEKNVAGEDRTADGHGVDLNVTARLARDLTVQAGTTTGRGVRDTCALWRARPQFSITRTTANRLDACDVTEPWLTTMRGLASYRIRRSTCSPARRSARRGQLPVKRQQRRLAEADYLDANTVVQQLLGRLPAGAFATGNTTVNLLAPSELYPLDRRTEVDIRIAKILGFGGTRLDVGVDVYNLFDAHTTTTYLQTYLYSNNGATWLDPTAILGPRLARLNATLMF